MPSASPTTGAGNLAETGWDVPTPGTEWTVLDLVARIGRRPDRAT